MRRGCERCTAAAAQKKTDQRKPLKTIALYGFADTKSFAALKAQAAGNLLCRTLTVLPPNELTPSLYRKRVKELASQNGWQLREFDLKALRKMGTGAFRRGGAGQP